MTRALLVGLLIAGVACECARAQADDTPKSAAAELARAYQKKLDLIMKIRRENEERIVKLEENIEKLDKELMGFESGREFQENLRNTVFEKYRKERELLRNAALANPEEVKGAVETGRALNVLLVAMGDMLRRQRFEGAAAVKDPKLDNFRKMAAELLTITSDDARFIPIKTNAAGEKLTLAIGADHPLKFALLPSLLRREQFKPLVKDLESAGDKALEELRRGEPVSPETEAQMLEAMNLVVAAYTKFVRETRTTRNLDDVSAALRAQAFVRNLRGTTRVFAEASRVQDVQAPPFKEGPFDDLLVHMTKHNLRFGPATNQRQRDYYMKLFQAMRLYFYDLALMDRLRTATKEELVVLKDEQKALTAALYDGKAEQAIQNALRLEQAIEMWGAFREALRLQANQAANGDG